MFTKSKYIFWRNSELHLSEKIVVCTIKWFIRPVHLCVCMDMFSSFDIIIGVWERHLMVFFSSLHNERCQLVPICCLFRCFGLNVVGNLFLWLIWLLVQMSKKYIEKQLYAYILTRCNRKVQLFSRSTLLRRSLIYLRYWCYSWIDWFFLAITEIALCCHNLTVKVFF